MFATVARVMRKHHRELERQISGAPGPHDFAVREESPLVSQRPHVHRMPASRLVTTAIRPSEKRGGMGELYD